MKRGEKTIVLAEGEDERVLRAADFISKKRISRVIVLGDIKKILEKMQKLKVGLTFSLIDPARSEKLAEYSNLLYRIRKSKGMTCSEASLLAKETNHFACLMLRNGDCDAVITGAVSKTTEVLRTAFQVIKKARGIKSCSAGVLIVLKNKKLFFSDISVQPFPDAHELAEIAALSSKTFYSVTKIKPKVAFLSYSTHGSSKSKDIDRIRKAYKIFKSKNPGITADGEIQVDAALVKSVAERKKSSIKGDANVLIFPNLDAANEGYKLVERLAGAKAIGMFLQGLDKPLSKLSKGCSTGDIISLAEAMEA